MSKKLNCTICDSCRKVISSSIQPIIVKSKKGRILHFCDSILCQSQYNRPKPRRTKTTSDKTFQHLITIDQAATFIDESNQIEEIIIPHSEALVGWVTGKNTHAEIRGQVKALQYVLTTYEKAHLDVKSICKLHTILMKDLLHPYHFGLRRSWVQVGGRICPSPTEINSMLTSWCNKVNTLKTPSELDIWQCHLAYEKIHPFIDGNGRSGRLLWLWLRYKYGFGYAVIENKTKHDLYYPQFSSFDFRQWVIS